jgi:hypothetical protein
MAAKQPPRKRGRPPETAAGRLRRYLLVGAAIGAYFGYFFRPVREPSLLFVVTLSLVAAVASTLLRAWLMRKQAGQTPGSLLRYGLRMWATFALFLAMLEGRHIAYDLGGRLATIAFTTLFGAALGLWYAFMAEKEGG